MFLSALAPGEGQTFPGLNPKAALMSEDAFRGSTDSALSKLNSAPGQSPTATPWRHPAT